jgi:hypothetical protein
MVKHQTSVPPIVTKPLYRAGCVPMSIPPYTLAITSCRRIDLLVQTLSSFLLFCDVQPSRIIVIEDSDDRNIFRIQSIFKATMDIIFNGTQLGQMRSIDRMYSEIDHGLIFHCEDDWLFSRSGFIRESHEILTNFDKVSMVRLRPRNELSKYSMLQPKEFI